MDRSVILIGGFIEVVELCKENNIEVVGIVDKEERSIYDIPYLGNDKDVITWGLSNQKTLLISPDQPEIRKKLVAYYETHGFNFGSLISNKADISISAKLGNGIIIQNRVNVSSEVCLGNFVKLNSLANIMHNVIIDDYTTVAPNAVVLGYVKLGKSCYIGANATVLPDITICDNVTIGAGAVVTHDIKEKNSVYAGIPARRIK